MSDSVIPKWLKVLVQAIFVLVVIPICMVLYTFHEVLPENTFTAIVSHAVSAAFVGYSLGGFTQFTVKHSRKRTGGAVK